MSGECDKCGEHASEYESLEIHRNHEIPIYYMNGKKKFLKCGVVKEGYESCKCNKHPATHPEEFEMLICEYGSMNILLTQEIDATCKVCKDKFMFKTERLQ